MMWLYLFNLIYGYGLLNNLHEIKLRQENFILDFLLEYILE